MEAKFCLPARFDEREFEIYDKLNVRANGAAIAEVYGSLSPSPFGSGRSARTLPVVTPNKLLRYVELCREHGYRFNYTLNGSCFGGREFTPQGRSEILEFVKLLADCGIDLMTVALPSLIELIAVHFPDIQLSASVILRVDSPSKARYIENLGARRIVLFEDLNRDFSAIQDIRTAYSGDLEVLVNSPCLFGCALREYHYTLQAHSHRGEKGEDAFERWMVRCNLQKLMHPEELVRSRGLIRPEDIIHYKRRGISYFKLVGREEQIENTTEVIAAYLQSAFEGNVFDLLPRFQGMKQVYHLDNRALDGFVDAFLEGRNPCTTGCRSCGYCDQYASAMEVAVPQDALTEAINALRNRAQTYIEGEFNVD